MSNSTPTTKATTTNPKDLLGLVKPSLSKVSPVALMHCAHAMMNGAEKYGPYNWRMKNVTATIYFDAIARHICAWLEGERCAEDSGVHHLGHAMACCAILLDAEANGNLEDDRPITGKNRAAYAAVLRELTDKISKQSATTAATAATTTEAPPEPGVGYRLLCIGEPIRAGDEFHSYDRWQLSNQVGKPFRPVLPSEGGPLYYRRRI